MSTLDLATIMDAIADALVSGDVVKNAYGWPAGTGAVPCALVDYPEIPFDATFQGGAHEATFTVYVVVGALTEKSSRDAMSVCIPKVKEALDGNLGGAVQTARVTTFSASGITMNAIEYLAAKFELETYT